MDKVIYFPKVRLTLISAPDESFMVSMVSLVKLIPSPGNSETPYLAE